MPIRNNLGKVERYLGNDNQDKNEDIYAKANSLISFMSTIRDTVNGFRAVLRSTYQIYTNNVQGIDKKLVVPYESYIAAVNKYKRITKLLDEFLRVFSLDYLDVETLLGEVSLVRQQHTNLMNQYNRIVDSKTKAGQQLVQQLLSTDKKHDKLTTELEKRMRNFSALERSLKDKMIVYQSFAGKKFSISVSSGIDDLLRIFGFDKFSRDRQAEKFAEEIRSKPSTSAGKVNPSTESPFVGKFQEFPDPAGVKRSYPQANDDKNPEKQKHPKKFSEGNDDAKSSFGAPKPDSGAKYGNTEMEDLNNKDHKQISALPSFISSMTAAELKKSHVLLLNIPLIDSFVKAAKIKWLQWCDVDKLSKNEYFDEFMKNESYLFPSTETPGRLSLLKQNYSEMIQLENLLIRFKPEYVNSLDFIFSLDDDENNSANRLKYLNLKLKITEIGYLFMHYCIYAIVSNLISKYKEKTQDSIDFIMSNIVESQMLITTYVLMISMQSEMSKKLKEKVNSIQSRYGIEDSDDEKNRKSCLENIKLAIHGIVEVDYGIFENLSQLTESSNISLVVSLKKNLEELFYNLDKEKDKYGVERKTYYERFVKNQQKK